MSPKLYDIIRIKVVKREKTNNHFNTRPYLINDRPEDASSYLSWLIVLMSASPPTANQRAGLCCLWADEVPAPYGRPLGLLCLCD